MIQLGSQENWKWNTSLCDPRALLFSPSSLPWRSPFGGTVWCDPTRASMQSPIMLSGHGDLSSLLAAHLFVLMQTFDICTQEAPAKSPRWSSSSLPASWNEPDNDFQDPSHARCSPSTDVHPPQSTPWFLTHRPPGGVQRTMKMITIDSVEPNYTANEWNGVKEWHLKAELLSNKT